MRLAKNIYSEAGLILLGKGMELTQPIIDRLSRYGIHYLYIEDARTEDIQTREPISEETRIRALKEVKTQFKRLIRDNAQKRLLDNLHMGRHFKDLLNDILDEMSNHQDSMVMISNIFLTDNYLFNHSLNVCLYSVLVGMGLGYSREELITLGLGAVLHDVGKMEIPQEILFKPSSLTPDEYVIIQKHSEIGFRMLKDIPGIPLIAAHCAFQHHERIDGSGYPRGIQGSEIHEFAKLIGLCDVYDALTTQRCYRSAKQPYEVMDVLYASSGTKFEQKHIEQFRTKIAIYPLGMTVQLSTGETGVVVDLNANSLHRPIIRVLEDKAGQPLSQPYEIDLSTHLSIMIQQANDAEQHVG